jgi:hypothetical protein
MEKQKEKFFSATKSVAKRSTVAILCTLLVGICLSAVSCDKLHPTQPPDIEGDDDTNNIAYQSGVFYVVGFDGIGEVDSMTGTAKSGGYLFISENLEDSLIVNNRELESGKGWVNGNLLDGIIDFPMESMMYPYKYCGFTFFREEYRFAFKVQLSYRPATYEEAKKVVHAHFCDCFNPYWPVLDRFKCVVIISTPKIQ